MSKSKLFTFLLIFLSLSAIFCCYNFDSAYAQGVTWTYNADTNTATASGSGSTNFAELVQADIDGGWGGVYTADATGTQILCQGRIVLGDGTNNITLTDTNKQITWSSTSAGAFQSLMEVKANATLTLGTLTNATDKATSSGCSIISNVNNYVYFRCTNAAAGTINAYSCYFASTASGARYYFYLFDWHGECYNTVFGRKCNLYQPKSLDCYRLTFQDNTITEAIRDIGTGSSFDDIQVTGYNQQIVHPGSVDVTFTNLIVKGDYKVLAAGDTGGCNVYFINCIAPKWAFWYNGYDYVFWRQYTFNLNVLNGNITDFVQNANVTLYKDNVKVYSGLTNSSGMIPTQTLTYGFYQQSTGNNIQNATSPYYLVITHPDWQTYVSRFYITEPLRLTVSMQEPTYTGYTEAEKSDYTTIILFIISLILCIIGLALTVPLLPLIALTISVINVLLLTEISTFNILLIILNIIFTVITIVRTKTKNN